MTSEQASYAAKKRDDRAIESLPSISPDSSQQRHSLNHSAWGGKKPVTSKLSSSFRLFERYCTGSHWNHRFHSDTESGKEDADIFYLRTVGKVEERG